MSRSLLRCLVGARSATGILTLAAAPHGHDQVIPEHQSQGWRFTLPQRRG